ncbi:MAG: DUF1493 family protein [Planctomycetes bacterium]|nr:DUF1493 family protein [Planctomycetota bacterium]
MSDVSEQTQLAVAAFVRERLGENSATHPDTRLLEDLGLDGDDARIFMEAFADRFAVARGDFRLEDHFGAEGLDPVELVRSLFGREHRSTPLTLRMLAEAAEAKVWIGSRPREDRG